MASCQSPFRVTAAALLSFLAFTPAASAQVPASNGYLFNPQHPLERLVPPVAAHMDFHLRHVLHHGTNRHPDLLRRLDIPPDQPIYTNTEDEDDAATNPPHLLAPLPISSSPLSLQRLTNRSTSYIDTITSLGRLHGHPITLPSAAWTTTTIPGPNITDLTTIISFAQMASNAYFLDPTSPGWVDIGNGYNYTEDFGWESDGLRGHIFADTTNSTVVIGLKGTSPAVFDGADTTTNDKINDNLFFSCCCAQGGSVLWHQVCDCKTATYTCNSTCLVQNLREKDRYYYAAQQLYHNVTALYPTSDVWLAGHSLGGAVAGLLGLTYGIPAVTFEAPGDAMPASRLGLPTPPGYRIGSDEPPAGTGGFHFGHTADPVYMGTCSSCSIAGYAMESVCHTGMECRYDTVRDLGYSSYIGKHKIGFVIENVLEAYDEPAKCEVVRDCVDCFSWKYFESNSSSSITSSATTTSSSMRHSQTRTETCKTPGWFGCLDESTTGTATTMTTTTSELPSTSSTSTCETPGWFGCLDETTTTEKKHTTHATTITSASSAGTTTGILTTTCETPGWLGCYDRTSTKSSKPVPRTTLTFGPTRTGAVSTSTSSARPSCRRSWFTGRCKRRRDDWSSEYL